MIPSFNSAYTAEQIEDAITRSCVRAWANFNGQGTIAIRGSMNVSSILDGGVGVYSLNFITSMPHANHATIGIASYLAGVDYTFTSISGYDGPDATASHALVCIRRGNNAPFDPLHTCMMVLA